MRYRVTALTPLLVGDGNELSPIDYMVWKDQVNVLDQNRIFKLLARGPRLEGYLTQLRKATKLDFASWGGFAQSFSQRRIPFETAEAAALWGTAPPDALFIPTFAANHRGAYLPASAIKGALRTGLVYSRWNAGTMDRIAASLEGDRVPRRIAEAAENQAHASQTRILGLADSEPVNNAAFRVYLTRTSSLDTRQPEKPALVWKVIGRGSVPNPRIGESSAVFAEMAVPQTEFEGTFIERAFLESPELTRPLGWRSVPSLEMLCNAANQYAAAQLDLHTTYARTTGLVALYRTVERLREVLVTAQNTPLTCLLCMGWGGGFTAKTAFLDMGQESYRKVLRAVPSIGKAIRENVVFPKTRRVVFERENSLSLPGWAVLQLQQ
jgi:CRISPR-associated protein Csm5